MSLDQIDTGGTKDAPQQDEDEHRLDAVIANLNSRVSAFEQRLESAVQAEDQFHTNIQTLLDSLDAFVERHVEKDRHLTQLIEEDTQRSKEAKEEYDALASRFDDNLRKDNLTRTRDWLRTVSVYVGIVLSVVLMAPLHAFWWLLTRTLTRMGLLKSSEEPMLYSNARRRGRFVPPTSERSPAGTRHRRTSSVTNVSADAENLSPRFSSVQKRNEDIRESPKEYDCNDPNDAKIGTMLGTDAPYAKESSDSERSYASSVLVNDGHDTGSNRQDMSRPETESEGEEEFFDAQNDTEEHVESLEGATPAQTEEKAAAEKEDSASSNGAPHRPGWAVPAGSDEILPDMSSFPSSDFWEISDEDIRLEVPPLDKS